MEKILDGAWRPAATPQRRTWLEANGIRHCRVCCCTDNRACPGGCWWIEAHLCSRCGPSLRCEAIAA